jgi:hypothetical protein
MWTKYSIKEGTLYTWKGGTKEVLLKKREKEWLFHVKDDLELQNEILFEEGLSQGSDLEWSIFIGDKKSDLHLSPALPDRPIVVKPSTAVKILPGKEVLIFVQVPLYLQFYNEVVKKENLIFESPTQELSSTWFGEPDAGSLAFSLNLDFAEILKKPVKVSPTIICPIHLVNESEDALDVQRLLLQVEYLHVYANKNELWANEVKIRFKGENEVSDVQYINKAPNFGENLRQISAPRSKTISVISKSFHFIKSLTNY